MPSGLGWIGILRLGLVQTALGSIVVLTTSTLNRVMVVELALAAAIPGALVGLHYGVQILRPLWGHRSDRGGRRTPWIVGGVALLGLGATGVAVATSLMAESIVLGLILAVADFVLIGIGVGAAGTSLLALLASGTAPERRPAAATIVWLMMIFGMAATATIAGGLLDPFSFPRLIAVTGGVAVAALLVTIGAVWRVEAGIAARPATPDRAVRFRRSLAETWADPRARLFTIFIFASMLAYSAQDLILEPFAGLVFAMTPGETTRLAGLQHGGALVGMLATGLAASLLARRRPGALWTFTVAGCAASALALLGLVAAATMPALWPLKANVVVLGAANGVFTVSAIGSMMALSGAAGPQRTGTRMGLWGASQAIAFGLGGFLGTIAVDILRAVTGDTVLAYGAVFALDAALFLAAAAIALAVAGSARPRRAAIGAVPAE